MNEAEARAEHIDPAGWPRLLCNLGLQEARPATRNAEI